MLIFYLLTIFAALPILAYILAQRTNNKGLVFGLTVIVMTSCLIIYISKFALIGSVQKQIIKLLIDLQKDLNLSYLFISHDLELVSTISHRMVVMKDGMIVDEGTPARLLRYSKNEYTKRLVESSIF